MKQESTVETISIVRKSILSVKKEKKKQKCKKIAKTEEKKLGVYPLPFFEFLG